MNGLQTSLFLEKYNRGFFTLKVNKYLLGLCASSSTTLNTKDELVVKPTRIVHGRLAVSAATSRDVGTLASLRVAGLTSCFRRSDATPIVVTALVTLWE